MRDIEKEILEKLHEIEEKENIKILHAVESGSRSWGVASPDSDYDVRFIYARREDDYLRLDELKDTIEWQLDEVFDITGWDIKKALQHFHKGNATMFEWCNSPVVYYTTPEWDEIRDIVMKYFSEKVAMYHYYGTARSTYEGYLTGDMVKYKKYIYALRPILSCRYIEENHSAPPLLFNELVDKQLPDDLKYRVNDMLDIKSVSGEKDLNPQVPEIKVFIENELDRISKLAKEKVDDRQVDWDSLNELFRKIVSGVKR